MQTFTSPLSSFSQAQLGPSQAPNSSYRKPAAFSSPPPKRTVFSIPWTKGQAEREIFSCGQGIDLDHHKPGAAGSTTFCSDARPGSEGLLGIFVAHFAIFNKLLQLRLLL